MAVMIIAIAGFVFLLVLIMFKNSVKADLYRRRQIHAMQDTGNFKDDELQKSLSQRLLIPTWKKISFAFSRAARRSGSGVKSEAQLAALEAFETQLKQAGIKTGVQEYKMLQNGLRVFLLFVTLILAVTLNVDDIVLVLIIIAGLFMIILIPRYSLTSRIKRRQAQIQFDMPNVMDVLSVSIEAGLGFDAALSRVMDRFHGPLVDELAQVYNEIQMGRARREALASLAKRNDVKELQLFVSAIIQSEQYGTPIKNVLRTQSAQLRVSRQQRAQEKAMKAPVKMMLPMVGCIFPVIFIIILGPTAIKVVKQFMS